MKKNRIIVAVFAVLVLLCIFYGITSLHNLNEEKEEIKEFTAYIAVPGDTIDKENRIVNKIAEKTGAKVSIEWLDGKTASERISGMITTGKYPDFLHGADATNLLLEANALVPIEDYIEDYPNLYHYLTEEQWDSLRKEDGHIYFVPAFGVVNERETLTMPSGEAFWIQKRVLEWAGYPQIKTVEEYFHLIEGYLAQNPETDGEKNIGFEILCDDWRFFCMENPPMFLAGYPNDGCAIVDKETHKAAVYDTIPEAKEYFRKLSEMYDKGIIDPETFTLSYNQYLDRISKGNVLGMVDQYWEIMSAQNGLYGANKIDRTYVPLALTMEEGVTPNYYCREENINIGEGIGISVNCKDVKGALAFFDGLLSDEVMILRHWGEEGIDYEVDENGKFYRNEEQRKIRENAEYLKKNIYGYGYFPNYEGMLADGINTVEPSDQPEEFYATLSEYDKKVLDAYGYKTWGNFVGEQTEGEDWYPLYSATNNWPSDSEYGIAKENMEKIKRLWLPKLIMLPVEAFDGNWNSYMKEYSEKVNIDAYLAELDAEIQRRIDRKNSK